MKLSVVLLISLVLVLTLYPDDSDAWLRIRLRRFVRRVGDAIRRIRVRRVLDKVCNPVCKWVCPGGICKLACPVVCKWIGRKKRTVQLDDPNRIPFPTKLSEYDYDGDGKISHPEFARRLNCTLENSKVAFTLADTNGDGFIDHIEFVLAPFDKSAKQKYKEIDDVDVKDEEELEELITDGLEDGLGSDKDKEDDKDDTISNEEKSGEDSDENNDGKETDEKKPRERYNPDEEEEAGDNVDERDDISDEEKHSEDEPEGPRK